MSKLEEVELTNIAVKYATDYVNRIYIDARGNMDYNKIEYSMALNTTAHGFYIGFRFGETYFKPRGFWATFFPREFPMAPAKLIDHSYLAAAAYIKEKGLLNLRTEDLTLIRVSVGVGFKAGLHEYEARRSQIDAEL